jgi:NADPH:quinone reductase-like Zn-dependent oxidoreductase
VGRLLGGFQRQMAAPLLSLFGGQRVCGVTGRERYEDLEELAPRLESGSVTPVIDRTYPLAEAADAIRYLAQGHPAGKVIITV